VPRTVFTTPSIPCVPSVSLDSANGEENGLSVCLSVLSSLFSRLLVFSSFSLLSLLCFAILSVC
jgi:hypothetical protein